MQKKQRETWLDVAKGLAIIFVVIGHVVTSYRNSGLLKDARAFNFVCNFLYTFHMPLFFVVGGYLSGKSQRTESLRRAVVRKCIAYGIPYVVFSVAAVGLKIVAQSVVNSKLDLADLLLIPVYPISSLWFIYALLLISVLQLIVNRLVGPKYTVYILAASFLVKVAAHWIGQLEMVQASGFSQYVLFDVGKYWFWYVLGEWAVKFLTEGIRQKISTLSNWLCIVATAAYVCIIYISDGVVGRRVAGAYLIGSWCDAMLCLGNENFAISVAGTLREIHIPHLLDSRLCDFGCSRCIIQVAGSNVRGDCAIGGVYGTWCVGAFAGI